MKDIGSLMKQAQGMQQKLQDAQARLAETKVEGVAGGGLVKLTLQGSGELKSVSIDPSLLTPEEAEVVVDLIVAAHAEAKKKLDAEQARMMQEAMGPLAAMAGGLPGLPGFPRPEVLVLASSAGPEIERLISLLSKLPGLGPRSARRAALVLLKRREHLLEPLAQALAEASARVRACSSCGALDTCDPCTVCSEPSRDSTLLCVVEEVGALWAMERGQAFRGRYHVLGGLLSALDGVGPDNLRIGELVGRAGAGEVREVILALPATVDGQTTAHYVSERLQATGVSVTSLARGVPVGGELDWLDDGTIAQALRARRPA